MSRAPLLQAPARRVSDDEFARLTSTLVGMRVSRAWKGHGSALFLELGRLERVRIGSLPSSLTGEATLMIDWSWRIERLRSVALSSDDSERVIERGLGRLKGLRIVEVAVSGRLPEIVVRLSGNVWVHSFSLSRGDEWALRLMGGRWLQARRGRLCIEG